MKQSTDSITIWQARIDTWLTSGSSMVKWCREQKINYNQFVYWKSKVGERNRNCSKITSSHFVELIDTPTDSGVTIECGSVQIRLTSDFDEATLQRCVQALRRVV